MVILTRKLLVENIGLKVEVAEKLLSVNASDDDLINMIYSTPLVQLLEPEALDRWEGPPNSNWGAADYIVDFLDHWE
jgi:hypothetical protein